ncbi:MAG: LacI family transcriptional regulator [Cyanothece sp. SIO1E1]|nr:LacI family transcriptional regulator [Cyanothece sp. SIO1E1]
MTDNTIKLKDIARILSVSESTVSRALRDHPRISLATRKRVKKLAEQLDYMPNQVARNLQNRHMNAIGVVVPKLSYHLYAQAISGMEEVAEQLGYNIIICQTNESTEREQNIVQELLSTRIAGFIISLSSSTVDFEHFAKIKRRKVPLVFFNRECEDIHTDRVIIDNFGVARQAVEHLINSGSKRIAYFGGPAEVQISNRRLEGYTAALKDHQFPLITDYIVHTEFNPQSAYEAAGRLLGLPTPPDAILAFSDQFAYTLYQRAREMGIAIPTDLSLIGFNNEPATSLLLPALSTVDQPAFAMGKTAAEILFQQIQHPKDYYRAQTKVLQSRLVLRGSTK